MENDRAYEIQWVVCFGALNLSFIGFNFFFQIIYKRKFRWVDEFSEDKNVNDTLGLVFLQIMLELEDKSQEKNWFNEIYLKGKQFQRKKKFCRNNFSNLSLLGEF